MGVGDRQLEQVTAAPAQTARARGAPGQVERRRAWPAEAQLAAPVKQQIVIVDDRRLIVEALTALLDATGRFTVSACATHQASPARIMAGAPDLVLFAVGDGRLPLTRLVGALRAQMPQLPTVILADHQDVELIRCVLEEGVGALILSDATAEDLVLTLDQVLRGHTALPSGWQGALTDSGQALLDGLSQRQLEVLQLLADGCTYEEISRRLIITVNTVKFHVRSIYTQLGVGSRIAAVRILEGSGPRQAHPHSLRADHPNGW